MEDWIKYSYTTVIVVLLLALIVSLILLMSKTSDLKTGYDYGNALQKECGDSFMERERGDFNAYTAYKQGVESSYKASFYILASIFIGVCFAGIALTGLSYIVKPDPKNKYEKYGIPVLALSVAVLFLMFIIIWLHHFTTGTSTFLYFPNPSPFATIYKNGKSDFYISQTVSIVLVFIGFALLMTFNSNYNKEKDHLLWGTGILIAVLAVLLLFIPLISNRIFKIKEPMDAYADSAQQLNNMLSGLSQEALNKLRENYYTIHQDANIDFCTNLNGENLTICKKRFKTKAFDDERFSYISHFPNYSDLQGINIPTELRPFILQANLRGETLLEVKRALAIFYTERNKQTFNVDQHASINTTKVPSLNIIVPYLTNYYRDLMKLTVIDANKTTDIDNKKNFLTVLNTYVITNDTFAQANPFTEQIYNKLQRMREDKTVRDTVNEANTIVKGLGYLVLFGIVYAIYHALYKRFPEKTLQNTTLLVISLLILGTAGGFVTKDMWL